jgi:uncharacterized membrane protein YdcZ (DUF606 family)
MKRVRRVLKWLACILGGAFAGSFLVVLIAALRFGLHDPERTTAFLELWARVGGLLGSAVGALIVFRSERRVIS